MANKTAEIKFLCEPEFRKRVDEARGLASLSAWVRDAIETKLRGEKEEAETVTIIGAEPTYKGMKVRMRDKKGREFTETYQTGPLHLPHTCTQCGQPYSEPPCGSFHATIAQDWYGTKV